MRLYATTTSERASKGQGGNEYLDIDIQVEPKKGQRICLAQLTVRPDERGIGIYDHLDNLLFHSTYTDKDYAKMSRWFKEKGQAKTSADAKIRLEYLRKELRAGNISYGEIAELQALTEYIDPGDVELLEAAGVPEFPEEKGKRQKGKSCGHAWTGYYPCPNCSK